MRVGNEHVGYFAVFDEVSLEIVARDVFRDATDENSTTQMRLRLSGNDDVVEAGGFGLREFDLALASLDPMALA